MDVLVLVAAAAFAYAGLPLVYTHWLRFRLRQRARLDGKIRLTFDDGPGSSLTPRILDLLDGAGVKATFFLLGRNVIGREALARDILRRGHALGSHAYDHLHHWKVSPWRAIADIRRGQAAIELATGCDAQRLPFRPPHGKLTLITLGYLLLTRTPIAMWTIDGGDTWPANLCPPDRAARLLERETGGVVLLHDCDQDDAERAERVLASLTAVIELGHPERFETLPAG